jgi:glycosyltransferase involved in cell wall biosynthesis
VRAQTYRNWEYIIVNNCSTDQSRAIALRQAGQDARIRVHDNDRFVSAMVNHRIGFRLMSPSSRYCKIVHADDWIFPNCLSEMVALAEAHPSVGVVSAYRLEGSRVTLDGLPYPSPVVPGREIARLALLGRVYVFGTPTSLLLRSDVVRSLDPFYPEEEFPRHWDTAACYDMLEKWDLGFVHQVLTFTRRDGAVRTALSRRMASSKPEHILVLKKYGPRFLDDEEYRERLKEMLRDYCKLLGVSFFGRPGREFWQYHRSMLVRLGFANARWKLARAWMGAVGDILFYPVRAFKRSISRRFV